MRISDVRTEVLRLPVVRPIGDGIQDLLVLEIDTDEGITGIGEVHTSPYVAEAVVHAPISHYAARGLREILVGRDPLDREELWSDMYRLTSVFGRRGVAVHAISGVDIALWDIAGKASEKPVRHLLGANLRDRVHAYASVLMPDTPEQVRRAIRRLCDRGFKAIKLGWGPLAGGAEAVLELTQAAREEGGDSLALMLDVGFGLDVAEAERLATAVEPLGVYFLEEPLSPDNLEGYARLKGSTNIRIAAGEKESTRWGFHDLMRFGRVDIVQPDLARAGGFTECKRILDLAIQHSIQCIPHCWSSDILVAAMLQFCAVIPGLPFAEFCTLETPLRKAVCTDSLQPIDGVLQISDKPGIGVELNRDTIEEFRYRPR